MIMSAKISLYSTEIIWIRNGIKIYPITETPANHHKGRTLYKLSYSIAANNSGRMGKSFTDSFYLWNIISDHLLQTEEIRDFYE